MVTVGLAWLWLLDPVVGPFNYYLRALGAPARSWLADPHTAMWAIILTTVWWVTGYYLVIYLAGLQDIPRELYEAAALDGATPWRKSPVAMPAVAKAKAHSARPVSPYASSNSCVVTFPCGWAVSSKRIQVLFPAATRRRRRSMTFTASIMRVSIGHKKSMRYSRKERGRLVLKAALAF